MKIGFAGAHGTGKTSLMEALKQGPTEFLDYNVSKSTARSAQQAGFKINRDADMISQLVTMCSRIGQEGRLGDKFISDRTPVDSLGYTAYQTDHVWKVSTDDADEAARLKYYWQVSLDLAARCMKDYDLVVYFPVYWASHADGVRDPDTEYQEMIGYYIKWYLDALDVDYITIVEGSIEDRVEQILNAI